MCSSMIADDVSAAHWIAVQALDQDPPQLVALLHVLQAIAIGLYGYLSFIFLPGMLNGGSPFVPTADEKLEVLFGSSGLLLPGGGVLASDDPPLAEQHLVDLGSGDGSVVRAATRMAGFGRASGFEINSALVALSSRRSRGRADECFFEQSLWEAPLADADVVIVYQLPEFLEDLAHKLGSELRHNTVVVSNAYPFPETPTLRPVLEVPVETPYWRRQDKSSSLWFYRVCRSELGG